MADLVHITDHVSRGVKTLAAQLQENLPLVDFFTALMNEVQLVQNAIYDLYESVDLLSATGDRLDKFGEVLEFFRKTLTDDAQYRVWLQARIKQLKSDGSVNAILTVINTISQSNVLFFDLYPAKVGFIYFGVLPENERVLLTDFVRDMLPAGVGLNWVIEGGSGDYFGFDGGNTIGFNSGKFGTIVGENRGLIFYPDLVAGKIRMDMLV